MGTSKKKRKMPPAQDDGKPSTGTHTVKIGLAQMLKGGVIMDVVNAEQARIAEEAGACAVMAKVRIGHFVEAQIIEHLQVDYIDESEVLTPADEQNHINKHKFKIPFVCGARNLGEALRRIAEGSNMPVAHLPNEIPLFLPSLFSSNRM